MRGQHTFGLDLFSWIPTIMITVLTALRRDVMENDAADAYPSHPISKAESNLSDSDGTTGRIQPCTRVDIIQLQVED